MAMEGRGPGQIATELTTRKILTPTAYHRKEGRNPPAKADTLPYHWYSATVVTILDRRDYTGCTVNFKTYTNSLWDKTKHSNAPENQKIFYGTHEAIIEQEVFDKVQKLRKHRQRADKTGKTSLFSGLVYCMDCRKKMHYRSKNGDSNKGAHFRCSTNSMRPEICDSVHFIREKALEQMVWKHMPMVMACVTCHEDYFRSQMKQQFQMESADALKSLRKQLVKSEKRFRELDALFIRIYEDNVSGKMTDERFVMMSENYESEQEALKSTILDLEQKIEVQEQKIENLEQFIQKAKKNADAEELTPYNVREMIKAIYIGKPDKSTGKRRQEIHIEYDLVGYIPLDELMKEVQA